jgi:hypothetical protein
MSSKIMRTHKAVHTSSSMNLPWISLMFILCIIRHIRKNQHYALICTTSLFYVLDPTCFSSSLPSSGSVLDPSESLEIQIDWVVYHIMCGYVTCVPDYHGSVCCVSQLSACACNHTFYDIPYIRFVFQVTQEDLRSFLMMAGYCQNTYELIHRINKWYKSVHIVRFF